MVFTKILNLYKPLSSAEAVASSDDILTEILLFMPAKPILRFKCVSKQWLSIISSPQFSHRHTRRHRSSASAIYLSRPHGLRQPEFNFLALNPKLSRLQFDSLNFTHDPTGIKILQSCNGLLLCCSARKIEKIRNYYVYNPTTRKFFTIPLPHGFDSTTVFGVSLAFDQSNSPHYKVVCVRTTPVSVNLNQIEIYSSETRAWRLSGEPFAAPFDMQFHNGVFWNGSVHWLSPTGSSLYFDIEAERLGSMPGLPVMELWGKRRFRYFGQSNGHLHLIEIYGPRTSKFDVLEMEMDYSKWFVKYHIDLDAMIAAFPEMVKHFIDPCDLHYYAFAILSLFRQENEEDSSLLLHIPGKVISYNFKDNNFKKLSDIAPRIGNKNTLEFGCLDAYQYIETLACV